ncbi:MULTISPECIES: transporter substrate-binding protein [Sinirhodobacter]|uniref:Twin-arginine translocation signal domain-containing protein n=2 Tax=Paenirhodobacter TaxID=1470577 RepID=A0A3S3LYE8_9RHOB|nr:MULTISPECIES: transporter substrate-binding protein [Sinirhodobacter]RWR48710.1 twin-arginine translocation signal domain-containing protein [Sinirhodobacter ferrireducens]RWR51155.1 twin-arginine translocation signal domain-containing protein [Sinirhodobacter huangdaonensis]
MTKLSRRNFLYTTGAAAAATLASPLVARAGTDTIKVGGLHDLSGALDSTGVPMNQVFQLAIKEINDAGGLLGKQVEAVIYDPQSNMSLYSQYATQLALKDKVDVVMGGITSASRETIRPIFHRYNTFYFYNTQYEGGVCDRNEITLGTTPAQTVKRVIPYAMNLYGKKVYTVAADYNYGHITAAWVKRYVEENGGEVIATEFFPLDVAQFGSTISKIQGAKPDFVLSAMVGTSHLGFYRQWAAAGMKSQIPIVSTVYGAGGTEQVILTHEESDGIIASFGYFEAIDNPTNKAFLEKVAQEYPDKKWVMSEISEVTYEGMKIWADAVKEAGSTKRDALLEVLTSGKTYDMPAGKVKIDPKTQHAVRDVYIATCKDGAFAINETFPDSQPEDTQMVCDLIKDPKSNTQYEISL